jgi:uncharacterized membrane protein YozB (DUF420 family)
MVIALWTDGLPNNWLIVGQTLAFVALGAVVGFIWRKRIRRAFAVSVPASVLLLAFFDWTVDRLHFWWEHPVEVFFWYFGLYILLCLLPTAMSALTISVLFRRRGPTI